MFALVCEPPFHLLQAAHTLTNTWNAISDPSWSQGACDPPHGGLQPTQSVTEPSFPQIT